MPTELDPIEGHWYKHLDKGQKFTVVAVYPDDELVEIQHFDGDIEELTLDDWYGMEIEAVEEPEDWTGPIDDVETDDLDYEETDMDDEDWDEEYDELSSGDDDKDYY